MQPTSQCHDKTAGTQVFLFFSVLSIANQGIEP